MRLRLGVIVGGAHGRNVLAHRGAEVTAARFLVEQRGIFVVELLQELICLGGSVIHIVLTFFLMLQKMTGNGSVDQTCGGKSETGQCSSISSGIKADSCSRKLISA